MIGRGSAVLTSYWPGHPPQQREGPAGGGGHHRSHLRGHRREQADLPLLQVRRVPRQDLLQRPPRPRGSRRRLRYRG